MKTGDGGVSYTMFTTKSTQRVVKYNEPILLSEIHFLVEMSCDKAFASKPTRTPKTHSSCWGTPTNAFRRTCELYSRQGREAESNRPILRQKEKPKPNKSSIWVFLADDYNFDTKSRKDFLKNIIKYAIF